MPDLKLTVTKAVGDLSNTMSVEASGPDAVERINKVLDSVDKEEPDSSRYADDYDIDYDYASNVLSDIASWFELEDEENLNLVSASFVEFIELVKIHIKSGYTASDLLRKAKRYALSTSNLDRCPGCGGPADNGHDRMDPPNTYFCSRCERTA